MLTNRKARIISTTASTPNNAYKIVVMRIVSFPANRVLTPLPLQRKGEFVVPLAINTIYSIRVACRACQYLWFLVRIRQSPQVQAGKMGVYGNKPVKNK